jgi:putative endonuclease
MDKAGSVCIMASRRNGTLYLGVTSDLIQRIDQHREGLIPGFSRKYGCKLLVWYQAFDDLDAARHRELQMKEWRRLWKLRVIEEMNPAGTTYSSRSSRSRVPAKGTPQSITLRGRRWPKPRTASPPGPGLRRDTEGGASRTAGGEA